MENLKTMTELQKDGQKIGDNINIEIIRILDHLTCMMLLKNMCS